MNVEFNIWDNNSFCHTAIENLSDPIGYLLDFTNPCYTALAGNMKARAKKDNSCSSIRLYTGNMDPWYCSMTNSLYRL